MADSLHDMAAKIVDQIVRGMSEEDKDRLFDAILSDKRVKDHVLKLIVWSFSGNDIRKDLEKTQKIRDISRKYERKRRARARQGQKS